MSFFLGFLLHKDIKYDTLDKKFQYYQENRDEYFQLKKMLKRMVVGSAIHNFFDPINSVEEYLEVVPNLGKLESVSFLWIGFSDFVNLVFLGADSYQIVLTFPYLSSILFPFRSQ